MEENNNPRFVTRPKDKLIADKDYATWLLSVKQAFRNSQAKAAIRVNRAMLEFYWNLGRDIERLHAETKWGSAFFDNLSLDLRSEFPNQKGFSVTNLKYIKRWYQFYYERIAIRHQAGDESEADGVQALFRHQVGDELEMPEAFALLPWRQHVEIIVSCHTIEEATFYVTQSLKCNWSRAVLKQNISSDAFARIGKATTNFAVRLPADEQRAAESILKSPYDFGFLHLKEGYDERELEDALVQNITHFLLELGQGFAFVGRQMELRMPDGESYFPDLVFYHYRQRRFIVVELKVVKFQPEFAGKLNFYVKAADELLRGEGDNRTIGLVICKRKDKTTVEWALSDIQKPLGVASYELEQIVERTIAEQEALTKDNSSSSR